MPDTPEQAAFRALVEDHKIVKRHTLPRQRDVIDVRPAQGKYPTGTRVFARKCGETKIVVTSVPDGADRVYTLIDDEGVVDEGWLEYELEPVRAP